MNLGLPPRPLPDVDISNVAFANLNPDSEVYLMSKFPICEDLEVQMDPGRVYQRVYHGGESHAISHLEKRITIGKSYERFVRKRELVKYQSQIKIIKVILCFSMLKI